MTTTKQTRCGFVALVGLTNAGKSTLVNAMVQEKVAIVSPKIHSTRFPVMGIVTMDNSQILFMDTPGFGGGKKNIRHCGEMIQGEVKNADIVLFLVDGHKGINDGVKRMSRDLAKVNRPVWVVFNKIDLIDRQRLLPMIQTMAELLNPQEVFMVSARSREGVDDLMGHLAKAMPSGPYLYPEDELTDQPQRVFVSEMIREEVLKYLHEEIPYNVTVQTDSFQTQKDKSLRIEASIYVPHPRYKSVVIGAGGKKIREIGMHARMMLGKIYGVTCHIFLNVRVARR